MPLLVNMSIFITCEIEGFSLQKSFSGGELMDQGTHLIDLARWLTASLYILYKYM